MSRSFAYWETAFKTVGTAGTPVPGVPGVCQERPVCASRGKSLQSPSSSSSGAVLAVLAAGLRKRGSHRILSKSMVQSNKARDRLLFVAFFSGIWRGFQIEVEQLVGLGSPMLN